MNTFKNKPTMIIFIPSNKATKLMSCKFLNCGNKEDALSIGPATN